MKKRISIIIPAYNEARTLPACLEAIAAQTVMPDEVIVVDNNSTDKTAQAARKYSFVKVIHERRQGIVFARNAGFKAASGELLARIDADTHIPSDWIQHIQEFYEEKAHAKTILTGGCYFYNLRSGHLTGRTYDFIVHRLNRVLLGYYFPWGSNCVIPVEAWQAVKNSVCMRTDIHEDLDLGICLTRAGYRTVYISHFRVATQAKRILHNHQDLWPYLTWWPETFRVNRLWTWPLVWPLVALVWLGSYDIIISERLLAKMGYKKHRT